MDGNDSGTAVMAGVIGGLFALVIILVMIAALWKIFTKAGQPRWAAIVPIYNLIVLLNIVGKPLWWIVLFMIPVANIYAIFSVAIGLAKSFGKSTGFGIGLILLSVVFYPILAFGSSRYLGPVDGQPLPKLATA
jgi:Family of unknown function (DUF5684)